MFPFFLAISLVLVAGSSIFMSVFGLMAVFADHSKIILCMGLGMEIGKLLVVSHLYRNWADLRWIPKALLTTIVLVLALLTSIEIMGFLSQSHVQATHELTTAETGLTSLEREAAIIREQLSVIDTTLAGLPNSHVTRRIEERNRWGYQEKQARLLKIAEHEAMLRTKVIQERQSAGPIFAVARIMNIEGERAVAGLILLLVLILEPLSIGLTVATTASWSPGKAPQEKKQKCNSQNEELLDLAKKHNLTVGQIVKITNRKKPKTCAEWLNGKTPVPEKALRAVKTWASKKGTAETTPKNTRTADRGIKRGSQGVISAQ